MSGKLTIWGTYDTGKPRVRLMLEGLRRTGHELTEINAEVWSGIEDKSQLSGLRQRLLLVGQMISAYPRLLWRAWRDRSSEIILVAYPGNLDILLLWPVAKLRGKKLVLDAFISLYNTVVEDRRMLSALNPLRYLLYGGEWLTLRLADLIITDTDEHADYFSHVFGLPRNRFVTVPVGAEEIFRTKADVSPHDGKRVLFYGQFIPLHGIETIIRAAARCEDPGIEFHIVGVGQEYARMRGLAESLECTNIRWTDWIDYAEIPEAIHAADVCLGVFGETRKSAMVVPNKVYQVVACGRPLVTADTPPVRRFLADYPMARLTPPGDPVQLLAAIDELLRAPADERARRAAAGKSESLRPEAIVQQLAARLQSMRAGPSA